MKKRAFAWWVSILWVGFLVVACAGTSKEVRIPTESVVVATPMVEITKGAQVILYGTGFAPKEEIQFVFKDSGGVETVVSGDSLKPAPLPNEKGAWVTAWDCGSYMSLIKPGL